MVVKHPGRDTSEDIGFRLKFESCIQQYATWTLLYEDVDTH